MHVRFWHLTDIDPTLVHVRYRGVKRTSRGLAVRSAIDPKATSPLRHPGEAHALQEALPLSEEG